MWETETETDCFHFSRLSLGVCVCVFWTTTAALQIFIIYSWACVFYLGFLFAFVESFLPINKINDLKKPSTIPIHCAHGIFYKSLRTRRKTIFTCVENGLVHRWCSDWTIALGSISPVCTVFTAFTCMNGTVIGSAQHFSRNESCQPSNSYLSFRVRLKLHETIIIYDCPPSTLTKKKVCVFLFWHRLPLRWGIFRCWMNNGAGSYLPPPLSHTLSLPLPLTLDSFSVSH